MDDILNSNFWYIIPFIICIIVIITFGYLPQVTALANGTGNSLTEYQAAETYYPCTNIIEVFNFQIKVLTRCDN
jgi:hypothetical protein